MDDNFKCGKTLRPMMKALVVDAKWEPKPGYKVSPWENETKKVVCGNAIWKDPALLLKEVDPPKIGDKDLLIRVRRCGVCGSDIHFWERDDQGYMLYPGLTRFPCTIGHEFAGVVEKVGSGVGGFDVGDLVTSEEMIWCGECTPCRDGYPNHCENLEEIGFTIPGAFAEYIGVGSRYCWKLNPILEVVEGEDEALDCGALVEPTSVAYNGIFVRGGGFMPGEDVAIYGAGPIGLAAIALCGAAGAGQIFAFEVKPERRELAKRMGANWVYDPTEVKPSSEVLARTDGRGVALSVEAAGAPQLTVPEMEKSLAINGKIVQIGRAAQRVPMYLESFQVRRAQLLGAQGHSGHGTFHHVISLMASGRVDLRQIITSRFPLDRAAEAIEKASKRVDGKVMVYA